MHFTTYMPGPHTNVGMAGAHTDRRKSSKIAPLAAAAVVWPRARRTHIVKNRGNTGGEATPAAGLRVSAGPSRVTHSLASRKIKLRWL